MPTYTLRVTLAQVAADPTGAQGVALGEAISEFFHHAVSLGVVPSNLRIQAGTLRIDTLLALDAAQIAHLGLS